MNSERNGLYAWVDMSEALTNDETCELVRKYRQTGDKNLRDKVIIGNMRLLLSCSHRFFYSFYHSSKYSQIEDLAQETIVAAVMAVEKFDPDKGIAFSTFLTQCVEFNFCKILKKIRKEKPVLSLSLPAFVDNQKLELQDLLKDERDFQKILDDRSLLMYMQNNILNLISKKERDIFIDYYLNSLTFFELADKYDVSHQNMNKLLQEATEHVCNLMWNGISETDIKLARVKPTQAQRAKVETGTGIVKKYGRENLVKNFVPKLTESQARVFKGLVLDYYGKGMEEACSDLGTKPQYVSTILKAVMKKLSKADSKLLKQKNTEFLTTKNQAELKYANKIIEKHGQKLFLYKYFVRILPEEEKRVFTRAVLDYDAESYDELAKKCGLELQEFKAILYKTEKKLNDFDFEILIELIDNADTFKTTLAPITNSKINNIIKRKDIVNQFGGVIRLRKHFLPILTDRQKIVFSDMYLNPKFDSLKSLADFYDLNKDDVLLVEKQILKKLKAINLSKREELYKRARGPLVLKSGLAKIKKTKVIEIVDFSLSDIFEIEDSKARKSMIEAYLKAYGGKLELVENLLPSIKNLSTQQVFVSSLIECKSHAHTKKEFSLTSEQIEEERRLIEKELQAYLTKKNEKNKIK